MRDGRAAIDLVMERVPATLAITIPALALKIGIGIPAGIYAALHRNSRADRITMALAVTGFTMPSFVLALYLVLIFAVQLGWLPASGSGSFAHAILPTITLGTAGAAIMARFTRSAMLEVLGQPYVRAASAKGVSWRRVITRHAPSQCRDPDRDHHRFHGRQPGRGCRGRGKASLPGRASAGCWSPAVAKPRSRRGAGAADGDLDLDGCGQPCRRPRLWLARSARTRGGRRGALGKSTWPCATSFPLSAPRPACRRCCAGSRDLPFLVHVSIAWLVLMIVIAFGADMLAPYSITAFDLKARLTPPVLMGGGIAHPLGSDELGRDVLSRLMLSIRMSLLIALFGTMIAASVGTALGFLAAHFRGRTEQLVLVAIDFQASMPFMIIALSVLAFFGNSLPLFIG